MYSHVYLRRVMSSHVHLCKVIYNRVWLCRVMYIEISSWSVSAHDFYSRVVKIRKRTSERKESSQQVDKIVEVNQPWSNFFFINTEIFYEMEIAKIMRFIWRKVFKRDKRFTSIKKVSMKMIVIWCNQVDNYVLQKWKKSRKVLLFLTFLDCLQYISIFSTVVMVTLQW